MQTDAVAQAADAGAGGMGALSQRIDSVNKLAGPAASAISGVTGAVGGLSSQAGAAVGAVANLAGAFATGGPLALGIVAIGTGISWLSTKYAESAKEAAAAEKAQVDAAKATASKIESLTQGLQGRISAARGIDDATLAFEQLKVRVQGAQAELDALQTQAGRSEFMRLQAVTGNAIGASDAYAQAVADAKENLADLDIELANAEVAYDQYNKQLALANRLEARKKEIDEEAKAALLGAATQTKSTTGAIKEQTQAIIDADGPARDYYDMLREQAEWEATTLENQRVAIDYINERRKAQEDYAASFGPSREMFEAHVKSQTDIMKEHAADVASIFRDTAGIVVNASDQLLSDLITGQENAFERFAVNIMRQAGTVMLGKGLELGANGIVNLMTGNPVGAGQLAIAAGLVGGGLALGAAATGIESIALGAGGSATTATAAAGPATTSTPMGAGKISGSQRDRGGPMQEAITYVFNAPVFGDQNRSAKHVALLQRRAQRDLLLA
jgi:hypothetical protein